MKGAGQGSTRGIVLASIIGIVGVTAAVGLNRQPVAPVQPATSTTARAAFDAALVAQGDGRYHDAREGYLRALSIDPKMADARYQLALLTHRAHADDEARHHLEELIAIAPHDPRVPALRLALEKATPAPSR
ncbi:MAG TPA: tetratricopeptide repeat protein [Polyangiaceae bacterium]|nr:tetratricopeptide repeat protein [Polyangiaceae bacterium]